MTFRISTRMMTDQAVSAMLKQQSQLSETQLQLSTGRRILTPSDDPAGAVRVLDYDRAIGTISQYLNNADRAQTRLEFEEGVIGGIENILIRTKELTVEGASDTLSQEDRAAIAAEIWQLRDELLSLGNTRDAQGEYIFAGYQTSTRPFAEAVSGAVDYQGDLGDRRLRISADREISDGDNGHRVFVDVETATGKRSLFETFYQLASDLENGENVGGYLDDIDLALANVTEVRTTIGARLNAIDEQVAVNREAKLVLETHKSEEGDLDYTEAISRFNRQTLALQAAQQAYLKVSQLSLFNYL
jgi:flagellar hook-associated protein 3 FlgL